MRGKHTDQDEHIKKHYKNLVVMTTLSFISMYILMYSMVNTFENVFHSFNQAYMAALMTAPMVIFEIFIMRMMYQNKRLNVMISISSALALIGFFLLIRQQVGISDRQFLRSMIPHHAGAILMCEQTSAQSQKVRELCHDIVSSQQAEIDQMKAMLKELDK